MPRRGEKRASRPCGRTEVRRTGRLVRGEQRGKGAKDEAASGDAGQGRGQVSRGGRE